MGQVIVIVTCPITRDRPRLASPSSVNRPRSPANRERVAVRLSALRQGSPEPRGRLSGREGRLSGREGRQGQHAEQAGVIGVPEAVDRLQTRD
jgi:hypothetical protein